MDDTDALIRQCLAWVHELAGREDATVQFVTIELHPDIDLGNGQAGLAVGVHNLPDELAARMLITVGEGILTALHSLN